MLELSPTVGHQLGSQKCLVAGVGVETHLMSEVSEVLHCVLVKAAHRRRIGWFS